MPHTSGWTKWRRTVTNLSLAYVTVALLLFGSLGLQLTALSAMQKMEDLKNGHYDNSMWIISQLEVDYQRFLLAVDGAIDLSALMTRPEAIAEVVSSFDIYFSRVEMVSVRARNLASVTNRTTGLDVKLQRIEAHLRALVPLIDNSADQDIAYFRRLLGIAGTILPDLRRNTMTSLQAIIQSDAEEYANRTFVLKWLLTLTQSMAILLFGIAGLILWLSRQLNRRTIDLARISSNLKKAIETSLDAVVITDISGRVTVFNSAAETMFGLRAADVKGRLTEDLLHPRAKAGRVGKAGGRQVAASLLQSVNCGRVRVTLQKSDGSSFLVEVAIASDVDSVGEPIYLAFLRDITKLVEADATQRAARVEAERSATANARFLAVMSHEMRTPLHGIISSLELLEGNTTPAESAALRRIAWHSAGSALEQIQEVLELAQHDAADVTGVVMTFFPVEIARIIVEQSQPLTAANGTFLALTFDPAVSRPMHGNRRAFRSALANLVGNAIKFTQNGNILVRLYLTPEGSLRIEVTDTGIGIKPKDQARIFEDFETVATPSLETIGTSGLGLGIARRAVGLMGGTLDLDSSPGKGSRFWFDIPQSPHAAALSSDFAGPVVPNGFALTVLVVDDNAINCVLLAQMLERSGHTVEMANDGPTAVRISADRKFDLILMDINMPGMDGAEAM